jgi:hypothetical protein
MMIRNSCYSVLPVTATQPRRFIVGALFALAALGAACNTRFSSAPQPEGNQTGDALAPGVAATAAEQVARDVEEADIIKIVDGKLYALNRYKGLLIVDVSNPDSPALLGTLDLRGRGVEMYLVGQRVYVMLSADYVVYAAESSAGGAGVQTTSIAPGPPIPPPDFEGSQLGIIDVSNPAVPAMVSKVNLAGYASDSRRVGDVLYVVGATGSPFYFRQDGSQTEHQDEGFVASVNVADPNNVVPVQRTTFAGTSLAIHVSDSLILAASHEYDANAGQTDTRVQAIDISDPAGAIAIRGSVNVPGVIRNRFYMDDYDDVLRIVTQSTGFGFRDVKLFTYDLSDLDDITPLGQVLIKQGESLEAVRFDGQRGFAVTFLRVDPLFVLDLRDPANPAVTGELEVPGFSTHIEPRGNRLVAMGVDNTDGTRPAVAYYDVADPAHPAELGRIVLGPPGSYTESEATYDEKAFKIVDELGLIAVPFHHVEYPETPPGGPIPIPFPNTIAAENDASAPTCLNAVQLVDFSDTALTQRGWFPHKGRVERVGAIGGRAYALSQSAFQTVNISDRDKPVMSGEVKFFGEADSVYYDDCGYIIGIDPDFGSGSNSFDLLAVLSRFCGAVTPVPLLMLACCLTLMKGARFRRRYPRQ